QTPRGFSSFITRSASEVAPIAFSFTRSLTALGERSNTTHVCPFFSSRRTMFAPILPRPIIPICINHSFVDVVITRLFEVVCPIAGPRTAGGLSLSALLRFHQKSMFRPPERLLPLPPPAELFLHRCLRPPPDRTLT